MTTQLSETSEGPNEHDWRQLERLLGEDHPYLSRARAAAMATIQRERGELPRWDDDEAYEKLYGYAVTNYRTLVEL